MREGVAYRCQSHALIAQSLKCDLLIHLTAACLANNGTVAGVKSTRQITIVLLRCYRQYE